MRRVLLGTDIAEAVVVGMYVYDRPAVNLRFGRFFLISDFTRRVYDFDKTHENLL